MDNSLIKETSNNWNRILSGAHGYTINKKFLNLGARIPLLSLDIDIKTFYFLWLELYPILMNSNSNSIELIVDDNDEIRNCTLHKSNKDGMYIETKKIEVDTLPNFSTNLKNVNEIYNILRVWVKKTYSVDIGNLRIIPLAAINDFVSIHEKYFKNGVNRGFLKMIGEYLDVIVKNRNQQLLLCYPPSPVFDFLSNFHDYFGNFSYFDLMKAFRRYLPKSKMTVTFRLKEDSAFLPYFINISQSRISIQFNPVPDHIFSKISSNNTEETILKFLKKDCNTKLNFIFQLKDIKELIFEVIQSQFPIQKDRLILIEEKFLNFYRNIGNPWNMSPKPYIYNNNIRFWIYFLGFYINPRKLSFWSIPTLLHSILCMFFNLSGDILLLTGKKLPNLVDTQKMDKIYGFNVSMNDGVIKKIEYILDEKLQNIIGSIKNNNLERSKGENNKKSILSQIRTEFSDKITFVSSIVWVSDGMISKLFKILLIDFHQLNRFSGRKLVNIIQLFRKNQNFLVFPENPLYKRVKKQNSLQFLKSLTPIFTDLHEF
ncbi:hypothetical protein DSAG12_00479 [Promethearchaeum syntrophicum]|uniref:Uncharacterized protein n=1 Tax=Promethearchaeum syntrophicum TaxID=2594042 RepID=A0A5B9D7W2_9ARCH|nr:hypothetical protein [Candidatus Prometheoarchaeum syntrophicum]QEE14666.1 hypothetical protein DSAG12_00479 [Candidatus Prometheoarchaeum syntrophicum]